MNLRKDLDDLINKALHAHGFQRKFEKEAIYPSPESLPTQAKVLTVWEFGNELRKWLGHTPEGYALTALDVAEYYELYHQAVKLNTGLTFDEWRRQNFGDAPSSLKPGADAAARAPPVSPPTSKSVAAWLGRGAPTTEDLVGARAFMPKQDLTFGPDIRGDWAFFVERRHLLPDGLTFDNEVNRRGVGVLNPVFFRIIQNGVQQTSHGFLGQVFIPQYGRVTKVTQWG